MKKRKSLVVTYIKIFIVIAIIVVGIILALKFLNKEYNSQEYETIKTDMLLIQGQTEVLAQKVAIEDDDAEYIGTKLEDKEIDETIQNLIDKEIVDLDSEDSNYYCLDNSNLEELGLEDVRTDNFFIVDYKQNDIIYIDGIEDAEGNIVYKLSDMK